MREGVTLVMQPTCLQISPRARTSGQRPNDADVAHVDTLNPPRIERVGTELQHETTVEAEATLGSNPPPQENVLVGQLEEEEADVAGVHVYSRHWLWEMLEEARYDVW